MLVLEHRLESRARNVAVGFAVDRVTDRHVVGGHALRDGARSTAHLEKPAHDFLPGADFGKTVVHGHTISPEADIAPNRIGIDTGAYYSGHLTCLVLEGATRRFIHT